MENSGEAPQKIKIELLYDPVIPILGTYPKKMDTLIQKVIYTPMLIAALFTTANIGNNLSNHQQMNG